jgi:histidinol-phosphate aminotransferase
MYAVCARLHGTRVVDVPLLDADAGYACDFEAVAAAAEQQAAKLVFLCSPGNPGGNLLSIEEVAALAKRLQGRALVVVDEAYIEFSGAPSAVTLLETHRNVAVLRTLSKVHALAAARVGCVIADVDLIAVLQRCQAPYPLPVPSVEAALSALSPAARVCTEARVGQTIQERSRMQDALAAMPGVRRVVPSHANFLLVRCYDAQEAFDRLLAAGVVVRDLRAMPGLEDALRVSIGTAEQNARVLAVLGELAVSGEVAA